MISEVRRLQYLEAMGFDTWISRSRAARLSAAAAVATAPLPAETAGPERYLIGPGSGQTLLLCQRQAEAASKLASDISRCLDEAPVWGWQVQPGRQSEADAAGQDLETAIGDRLFTRVLVFGMSPDSAQSTGDVIGSARIIHAPSLPELSRSPEHKRSLWARLVANGWCRRFA